MRNLRAHPGVNPQEVAERLAPLVAAELGQKPENLLNPPNWIWGEWSNLSGSEPNKIERIVFSENEIELVQSLADPPGWLLDAAQGQAAADRIFALLKR